MSDKVVDQTSLRLASHLGSRHDATRSRISGARSYRPISAARARAAASGRRRSTGETDGRTDGHPTVTCTLQSAPHNVMPMRSLR